MGKALYRRYRPHSLKEVAGQEHITRTLTNAVSTNRLSHAYLFTGPRGVGKTSIARILAHEVNGLSYDDDGSHIDIIEIDAASNRRIDEIRDLRDKVYIAPAEAKYKVYIIDEVHMLTKEAFNALLKTLEEPPAHVIFILATTDSHKLPETIISRTQRFNFKPINQSDSVKQLQKIAKEEKIKVTQEALQALAEHGQGSLRDSLSLLDQASSEGGEVNLQRVLGMIGMPPEESMTKLIDALNTGQPAAVVVEKLSGMLDQGYTANLIAKLLFNYLRNQLIENRSPENKDQALKLMTDLIEVPAAHDPDRFLELTLIRAAFAYTSASDSLEKTAEAVSSAATTSHGQAAEEKLTTKAVKQLVPAPKEAVEASNEDAAVADDGPAAALEIINQAPSELDSETWDAVLAELKQTHNTLYSILRMSNPNLKGNQLSLVFAFDFHRKRISEAANKKLIADQVKKLTGLDITIECFYDKQSKPQKASKTAASLNKSPASVKDESIVAISSIFEGAELLES